MIAQKPQNFTPQVKRRDTLVPSGGLQPGDVHDLVARLDNFVEDVRLFRREMVAVWPTPTTEDSLWFAHSESGEVSDAVMRLKPEYVRNNHRTPSVQGEMADQAVMLASAIAREDMSASQVFFMPSQDDFYLEDYYNPNRADIYTAEAKFCAIEGDVIGALDSAVDALICLFRDPRFAPAETHVALKMDTLRRKHLLKEE